MDRHNACVLNLLGKAIKCIHDNGTDLEQGKEYVVVFDNAITIVSFTEEGFFIKGVIGKAYQANESLNEEELEAMLHV